MTTQANEETGTTPAIDETPVGGQPEAVATETAKPGGKPGGKPAKPPKVAGEAPPAGLTEAPRAKKPGEGVTEGRIVHYVLKATDGSGAMLHRAAIITRAIGTKGRVDLNVMICRADFPKHVHPGAILMMDNVQYDPECAEGTWHWPEPK